MKHDLDYDAYRELLEERQAEFLGLAFMYFGIDPEYLTAGSEAATGAAVLGLYDKTNDMLRGLLDEKYAERRPPNGER